MRVFGASAPLKALPSDVSAITVQGRDLVYGYGGRTVTVPVPHGKPAGTARDVRMRQAQAKRSST
jgi:hypothetical protein